VEVREDILSSTPCDRQRSGGRFSAGDAAKDSVDNTLSEIMRVGPRPPPTPKTPIGQVGNRPVVTRGDGRTASATVVSGPVSRGDSPLPEKKKRKNGEKKTARAACGRGIGREKRGPGLAERSQES